MKYLLLLALLGCQTSKTLKSEECNIFLKFKTVEVITEAGGAEKTEIVDVKESGCSCRQYFYGINRIGPDSSPVEKPLNYCNRMIGSSPRNDAFKKSFFESVRQDIARRNKAESSR